VTVELNIFNNNWPEGIVSLVEIFVVCCLIGGLVTFVLCRTRQSYKLKETADFKAADSNRLVSDKNKDVR
jgi:hypothetical protein